MMSKKQWFVLLCLFIIYLLLGASIFFYVESQEEMKNSLKNQEEMEIIEELLKKHYKEDKEDSNDNKTLHYIFNRLTDYCGKPIHYNMSLTEPNYKWDFYHSLFFVITVVSTIGYGNLAPTTMFTRIFMIFYGLIGIPMNGIVMVTMGEYFGKSFKGLYRRWKNTKIKQNSAKFGLVGQIILYAVPGLTFFIFLPATIMSFFEGWAYDVAVYYSFVTHTTIGFGDYVAGVNNVHNFGSLVYACYKIFLLVWVIGGLGYIVMLLGFITQGMRSKRVIRIEKMLAENIKKTPQKIRNELRSVLQEFLFMRDPVYKGEFQYIPHVLERRQSCPDLSLWRNKNSPSFVKKRAISLCYQGISESQSDTDINKVNKKVVYRPSDAFMQQKDLLLKVVDALSFTDNSTQEEKCGIHGFSDREILASETYNNLSALKSERRRAISDIRPPYKMRHPASNGNTWYGTDATKAFNEFNANITRTASSTTTISKEERPTLFQRIKSRFQNKDGKNIDVEKQSFEDISDKHRASDFSIDFDTYRRRPSALSLHQEQVLEQTSIADFIRALTAVTVPETTFNTEPRRKLGVASLVAPEIPSSRKRTMSIVPNFSQNRRTSLINPPRAESGRRFSLRPVEENLLISPPPYTAVAPEPQNILPIKPNRKFSIKQTNVTYTPSIGTVKSQLHKRKTTDSGTDG